MPKSIDLEPGNLDSYRHGFLGNLDQAITDQFNDSLRASVSRSLVQPEVDADQLIQELHGSINQAAPGVFSSRYKFERQWEFVEKPLSELLGRLALTEEDVTELVPDEAYVTDLHRQLDDHRDGIETLKTLHDVWPIKTFEYLSILHLLTSEKEKNGDAVLEIVGRMSEDAENITLDPHHSEGLLLLTYLPGRVRQLTRRALAGNHIVAKLRLALGEHTSSEEEMLLELLQRYYILDNLHGQQWEDGDLTLSEDSQIKIARYSAEQLATLAKLQREADKESGFKFKEAWEAITKQLEEVIEVTNRSSRTQQWQLTDIGHAFEGFMDFGLLKAFRRGAFSKDGDMDAELQPEKSGLRAAILEDDDSQRALWRETIESSTSFTTEDTLTYATPDGIEEVIDDPTIGLFLLDIQNGDDKTAGIRIGEEIARRRSIPVGDDTVSGQPLKTKIIVWSASSEAVEQAGIHLRQLIEDSMPTVSYYINGSSRHGDSAVMVEVRRKAWHAYGDIK